MKLVEILARELKVWPEGTDGIWQSAQDNELYLDGPPKNQRPEWLCDDRGYDGRVTRADWEAEQPAPVSEPESELLYDPVAQGPLQWRDRIHALDTKRAEVESVYQRQISEIAKEREGLVGKLAGEGLALVERVQQPVEDMSDWRNWQVGDFVEVVFSERGHRFDIGEVVRMKSLPDQDGGCIACEFTDGRDYWVLHESELKWHSHPAK